MSYKLRATALMAVLAGLIVLTGCVSSNTPIPMIGRDVPLSGGPLGEDVWQGVDEYSAEEPDRTVYIYTKNWSFYWPLPASFYYKELDLHTAASSESNTTVTGAPMGNKAQGFAIDWNDIIAPLVFLPLRVVYSEFDYDRATQEPVNEVGFGYTPFWAWSWKRGDTPYRGVEYGAWGVPLLISNISMDVKVDDPEMIKSGSMTNVLWTVGPMVMVWDSPDIEPETDASAYYVNPLFLGGTLGQILWASYEVRSTETHYWVGHGPFFGTSLYYSYRVPEIRNEKTGDDTVYDTSLRNLLGGLLWQSWVRRDADSGEVIKSHHGPIWGMIALGKHDREPKVRLFWFDF